MIRKIVNGQNDRQRTHRRIGRVLRSQQSRHQRGLPIMAMNHVRQQDALRKLNRHAGKFREALGIIRIFAGLVAVRMFAIEVSGIINEEIAHSRYGCSFRNRGEPYLLAKGNCHARNQGGGNSVAVIARQQNRHLVAHFHQRLGQRFHHIGQAAGL